MSQHYRVFLGAPSASEIQVDQSRYRWETVESAEPPQTSIIFPAATLDAAGRRISLLYENTIFDDTDDEEDYAESEQGMCCNRIFTPSLTLFIQDQTTAITWPPTPAAPANEPEPTAPSFLNAPVSRLQSFYDTQDSASYNYSDASSIARFPAFHFSLHSLTSISALCAFAKSGPGKGSKKASVVLAALEVEGPDTIRVKRGPDAGKDVSILKMIMGDEEGTICKLTAWREVADAWGGSGSSPRVKRGDIVFMESEQPSLCQQVL